MDKCPNTFLVFCVAVAILALLSLNLVHALYFDQWYPMSPLVPIRIWKIGVSKYSTHQLSSLTYSTKITHVLPTFNPLTCTYARWIICGRKCNQANANSFFGWIYSWKSFGKECLFELNNRCKRFPPVFARTLCVANVCNLVSCLPAHIDKIYFRTPLWY